MLEIYNTMEIIYADPENKTLAKVMKTSEKDCAPRRNTVFNEWAGIDN
jgi:hypothetical protein